MNRRVIVSVLAILLVITMVFSLVITVIPVGADAAPVAENGGYAYTALHQTDE